jgi:pyruvate/2-oxoglutarate dehydrogenase complex dihydrolipoamide dehydrogenase (E3) component
VLAKTSGADHDPEVAAVGLTESRATKRGIKDDLIEPEMPAFKAIR